MTNRLTTKHVPSFLDEKEATELYNYLRDTVQWEDGIRSRHGFTRKAKPLQIGDVPRVDQVVFDAINNVCEKDYVLLGIYLNYYEDGKMYTPNHTHKGQHQIVLSLGATRTLNVGKKAFELRNGDLITFGSSIHGIPKDDTVQKGRISIATFMMPM